MGSLFLCCIKGLEAAFRKRRSVDVFSGREAPPSGCAARSASTLVCLNAFEQVAERKDCKRNQRPPHRRKQQAEGNDCHEQRKYRKDECDKECNVLGSR